MVFNQKPQKNHNNVDHLDSGNQPRKDDKFFLSQSKILKKEEFQQPSNEIVLLTYFQINNFHHKIATTIKTDFLDFCIFKFHSSLFSELIIEEATNFIT